MIPSITNFSAQKIVKNIIKYHRQNLPKDLYRNFFALKSYLNTRLTGIIFCTKNTNTSVKNTIGLTVFRFETE